MCGGGSRFSDGLGRSALGLGEERGGGNGSITRGNRLPAISERI